MKDRSLHLDHFVTPVEATCMKCERTYMNPLGWKRGVCKVCKGKVSSDSGYFSSNERASSIDDTFEDYFCGDK